MDGKIDWDQISYGRYAGNEAEQLIQNVLVDWPQTYKRLLLFLEGLMPIHLDCFCSGVLKQIQHRGDMSLPQAQKLAIGCLRSIAAKYPNNKKGDYNVSETLNVLAPQVPSLMSYVAGFPVTDIREYEDLWELKTALGKNARALDFTNVIGGAHILDKSVAECICKVTYLKLDVLTLRGKMDWRGIEPWAFEPVADAFAGIIVNSHLSYESKLLSLVHESGLVLSAIGGFNSISGLSENNTNDIAIGVITLNSKIEELITANVK